jgi:hypothetical protein
LWALGQSSAIVVNGLGQLGLLDGSMPYVRIWLRAPHPALGGRTPLSSLLDGQFQPVEDLVHAIAAGQPD